MGTWSSEPFGNDTAADWAGLLAGDRDWSRVRDALATVSAGRDDPAEVDSEEAVLALAAAEVVARSLGRPTQDDAYTQGAASFVGRAPAAPADLHALALDALEVAAHPDGDLADLWADADPGPWQESVERLRRALTGGTTGALPRLEA